MWMTKEILKIVRDMWEAKVKGDKSRVRILNVVSQWLSGRDKKNYYNRQCKAIEKNQKKEKPETSTKRLKQ